MRQSKKLILLAALLTGLPLSSGVGAVPIVDSVLDASTPATANIGASVNATVQGLSFAPLATDTGCVSFGTTSTAFVTAEGLNPLGTFATAAEFWANQTGQDVTTFTSFSEGTTANIAGLTGEPAAADFQANMTRDIVVGCGQNDGTLLGLDIKSVTKSEPGSPGRFDFLIEVVAQADWFAEVSGVKANGVFYTTTELSGPAAQSTGTFELDALRPLGPTAINRTVGTVNLAASGGADQFEAADFTNSVQVINFTAGSFSVAGIGDGVTGNITTTVPALAPILSDGDVNLYANFPTIGEILVFDVDTTPSANRPAAPGNVFLISHTIVEDVAAGQVLAKAQTIGGTATFYAKDDAGNVSSYNVADPTASAQKDLVATPLSAIVNVAIANKSYQLVAADFDGLATGDLVSRGAVGDLNGLQMKPAATPPTLLNLTVDLTAGGNTQIYYTNPTRAHIDAALGEGNTRTVDLTGINAGLPAASSGGFVTGAIADGSASVTFGGTDAADNPLLPLTISGLTLDITPPTLLNFSPTANTDDPVTDPGQMTFRGRNSEDLSASTLDLTCDTFSANAASPTAFAWTEVSTDIQVVPAQIVGGANDGDVIPILDSICSWAWTGVDLAGNAGAQATGDLSKFDPAASAETPTQIALTPSAATNVVGTAYTVTVEVQDANDLAVFGIAPNAAVGDIVSLNATFTPDTGACALGSECTLVFSGANGVTDNDDNATATLDVAEFTNGALAVTVTNQSAGSIVFDATLSRVAPAANDGNGSTGTSTAVASTVDAISAISLATNNPSVNATAGANFWVNVDLDDQFMNRRTADADFVEISTNVAGATVPVTAIKISAGTGGFWASTDNVGAQTIWARGLGSGVEGSLTHTLDAVPAVSSVGGADVPDDQGNFIYLNITGVAPEAEVVRIWREVAEPVGTVSYATFDPPAGGGDVKVIVYTPDNTATAYAVTQETARNASGGVDATAAKQAFASVEGVDSYYELMAETMMQSKQAVSSTEPAAPIFAILTPDAIAMFDGVAPSFKAGDNGLQSSGFVRTEPIRAIDNIAPAAIQQLRAVDTPADAGGSISVTWQKSLDDRMLPQNTAQAVGANGNTLVAGVAGYNIYRKAGADEFEFVSYVSAGETSFHDNTVFNGLRYTYTVSPFDTDNVTPTELERTSMAIRNNVKDASGSLVMGLFGADNSVGFDDFFIFADFFGQTAADVAFDPAFDLNPNNRIDLDDFFVFADYFGRGVNSSSRVVPMLAGLNSDASLTLAAGESLPGVGEEMTIAVDLEDYVELRGYGFNLSYDPAVFEFVGSKIENDNLLGEGSLAQPQAIAGQDGKGSIIAFGETAVDGDLGLSLVFRAKIETEGSYIEITDGQLSDGAYGVNDLRGPVSVMIETRPEVYALSDNYPNPFNPATTIKYQLPEAGLVTLEVYNMLGQVVRTLVNEHQRAGRYNVQWDANNDKGQSLSSGMYFYHVQAGQEFQSTKKMLLLK